MGIIWNGDVTDSYGDYFTRNLLMQRGDYDASSHGYVSAVLLEDASEDPITIDEAKAHLRYTDNSENAGVLSWIRSATAKVQRDTGLALLPQRWRIVVDQFPLWRQSLILPIYPILSVDSFGYYDTDDVFQSIDVTSPSPYLLDHGRPARLGLPDAADWPTTYRRVQPGVIEVTAGWATPALVPEDLKQAIKLLVGQSASYREPIVSGPASGVTSVGMDYDRWISAWVLPSA